MSEKIAVIIGAGPAGLTAAYELLTRTGIRPIVLEKSGSMGGIARTVNYKGYRMDIGGHRFFSKSARVMDWWQNIMPIQADGEPDPNRQDLVMLLRKRRSRIYFLRKFFDYPIRLSVDTLSKLGLWRTLRIGLSYLKSAAFPIRDERTLEQFFINRFGKELYLTFFKSYTEKVWGVPCNEISAEWGEQRVKGLSIARSIRHFVKRCFRRGSGVAQKDTETSLIEQFLYPKLGPGQMWDEVASRIREKGGLVLTGWEAVRLHADGQRIEAVEAVHGETGERKVFPAGYFFSTMPVQELVRSLDHDVPPAVVAASEGLMYRDFITVGLLVRGLKVQEKNPDGSRLIRDNWIYIQEPDVLVGRLQIFNNWSPYLVPDPGKVWIGLEYFCNEGGDLWRTSDADLVRLAASELTRIGILDDDAVLDATVIRVPKAYPAYFGSYSRFPLVREYLDGFENLFLIGRNGMHRYNNQDHSMLTAMVTVDNLAAGVSSKENIWTVNAEKEYHESA